MEIVRNHMISVTAGLYLTKNTQVTYHQYPQHMETDQGKKKKKQIMKNIFTNRATHAQHYPCKEPQRDHMLRGCMD